MREKRLGVIEHDLHDSDTVYRMLHFMYTDQYDVETANDQAVARVTRQMEESAIGHQSAEDASIGDPTAEEVSTKRATDLTMEIKRTHEAAAAFIEKLVTHVRVYGLADYYLIPELKSLAEDRFMSVADTVLPMYANGGLVRVVEEICKATASGDFGGLRGNCARL